MTSIIKVDQIQNAAGGVPTAADLGLNVSGTVLQVVTETSNATASGINAFVDGVVTASITPKQANSKILCILTMNNNYINTAGSDIMVRILVNNVDIAPSLGNNTYYGVATYINALNSAVQRHNISTSISYSSGSTALQTWGYKVGAVNTASTYYVNYPNDRGIHTMTLIEIAG